MEIKFANVRLSDKERAGLQDLDVGAAPEKIRNPYSGEEVELSPEAVAIYDWIKGAEMLGHHDDVRTGLRIFAGNWPEAYMILLD